MLKIGDFSKVSRVSVKTLRYYDDLGLLRPVQIDRFTGYRYYSLEQLPRLYRILAYKDLGFSLEQIGRLLDEDLPVAQIRGMLRLKQAEIQDRLNDERARLARVEARLQQIEQEEHMPDYEIVLKAVEPQLVAAVQGDIPNYEDSGPFFDRMFDEVYGYVYEQGARPGCGMALYLSPEHESGITVQALAQLDRPIRETDRVQVYELPGTQQMASAVHHGPFATIGNAYRAMMTWIEDNGYEVSGPCRELYLQFERSGDQNQYVTEIQFPVVKK